MSGILLQFHCKTNTGYAILPLERVFHKMALQLVEDESLIHYGYPSLSGGMPNHLPAGFRHVHQIDPQTSDEARLKEYSALVQNNDIKLVFAFDMPVSAPILKAYRRGGVRTVISYWGASISSVYPWYLRPLRRLQYLMATNRPDHFIFESEGMRRGAVLGTTIPVRRTSVCRIGVDMDRFADDVAPRDYAYNVFGIPTSRKILFYSGHMEERKGVAVLMRAMKELVDNRGRRDVHLLVLGNQPGEEQPFICSLEGSVAAGHVTFGGYRSDVPSLHRSVYAGVIASTGWDSFTLSAVEMAASGIPLVVSRLPGLSEAVIEGETGITFAPADTSDLADAVAQLLDSKAEREQMGRSARERAVDGFSVERQVSSLVSIVSAAQNCAER